MKHPLDQAIERVRTAARRIALGYGIGLSLAVLLGGALAVGLLDYLLRVDATLIRVLLTLSVLLIAGWGVWRFLLPWWRNQDSDVVVAQRLQDRFPQLGDRLASAIEFLHQPEESPTAGSSMLRRAVIVDATVATKSVDLSEVLDTRPLRQALLAAGAAAALIAAVALIAPGKTWLGIKRLANPLANNPWPRSNELEFHKAPAQLAAGEMFEAELFDKNGPVPDDAQIEYRFGGPDDGRTFREPMRKLGNVMTASRENVQRSFSYRALAGDDETDWKELKVVEPAKLEALEVTIIPPQYTGWPRETSAGAVAALTGTELQMRGKSSKKLKSVAMKLNSKTVAPAHVEPDGRTFVVPAPSAEPLLVKDSGDYWFELTDEEGVVGAANQRFSMRAVPDDPPTVALEKPTTDLYLTAEATAPMRVLAKDRLALKAIDLHYTRSDKSAEPASKISLYSGPEKVPPHRPPGYGAGRGRGRTPPDRPHAATGRPEASTRHPIGRACHGHGLPARHGTKPRRPDLHHHAPRTGRARGPAANASHGRSGPGPENGAGSPRPCEGTGNPDAAGGPAQEGRPGPVAGRGTPAARRAPHAHRQFHRGPPADRGTAGTTGQQQAQ